MHFTILYRSYLKTFNILKNYIKKAPPLPLFSVKAAKKFKFGYYCLFLCEVFVRTASAYVIAFRKKEFSTAKKFNIIKQSTPP